MFCATNKEIFLFIMVGSRNRLFQLIWRIWGSWIGGVETLTINRAVNAAYSSAANIAASYPARVLLCSIVTFINVVNIIIMIKKPTLIPLNLFMCYINMYPFIQICDINPLHINFILFCYKAYILTIRRDLKIHYQWLNITWFYVTNIFQIKWLIK